MIYAQTKQLNVTLTEEDYKRADLFSKTQTLCSAFLDKHKKSHIGFTDFVDYKVEHKAYIWYIATKAFKDHASKIDGVEVKTWMDDFDLMKVMSVLNEDSPTNDDVRYIYDYFYNKHSIKTRSNGKVSVYDIRTAITKLDPKPNWKFVFSINKTKVRYNNTILLYCIGDKRNIGKIVYSGIIDHDTIEQCPVLRKGQLTPFGTSVKIDSHVTTLGEHYY